MIRFLFGAVAIAALSSCGSAGNKTTTAAVGPVAAVAPPAGTQWTSTVAVTPDGGYRMGNPAAPIKLVEYGSITCPHCAAFAAEGISPLKAKYVATGKVSYEFRSYLLHGQDLMATELIECGGAEPFFALLEAAYGAQQDWIGKLVALPPAEQQRLLTLPIAAQNAEMAKASGLDEFVAMRGVSREAIAQCLANPKTPDALLKQRDHANELGLTGTPTFLINDKLIENVASWRDLEPELRAAGA